ncbi:MAG: GYDIA family GHMP kinase [Bacteroidota bacterium]
MSSGIQTWSSNGKLLITGEYLVMEGALSFALPLKVGQSLSVSKNNSKILRWNAIGPNGAWFTAGYELSLFKILSTDNTNLAHKLRDILTTVRKMSSSFLMDKLGFDVVTNLDFDSEYGFGTSSTLISNIAMWADVNPYKLLEQTFGGSGYDIACAQSDSPILYQREGDTIRVTNLNFNPTFTKNIYFVYLGNKQNSSDSIASFKKQGKFNSSDISRITDITNELIKTNELQNFQNLLDEHEVILSKILGLPTVKSLYFSDFSGTVKSLGAWGGDFVLVTTSETEENLRTYMNAKGYNIIFSYDELVLSNQ